MMKIEAKGQPTLQGPLEPLSRDQSISNLETL